MKATSITQPDAIVSVGDGSYFYNWDIKEVEVPGIGDNPARIVIEYNQVRIFKPLTRENITEAVITALWPDNLERKLINDYNAVQLDVIEDAGHVAAYTTFLQQRAAIKLQIAGLQLP